MSIDVDERVRARAHEVLGASSADWCDAAVESVSEAVSRLGISSLVPVHGGRLSVIWRGVLNETAVAVKFPMVEVDAHLRAAVALGESGCGPSVFVADAGVLVSEWIDHVPMPGGVAALHHVVELAASLDEVPVPETLVGVDDWLRERVLTAVADVAAGSRQPTMVERSVAARELESLVRPWSFCHGDLHAGNVLWRRSGYPVLIDARGVRGEVELDCANLALQSRLGGPTEAVESLAATLAGHVGGDRERAVRWVGVLQVAQV